MGNVTWSDEELVEAIIEVFEEDGVTLNIETAEQLSKQIKESNPKDRIDFVEAIESKVKNFLKNQNIQEANVRSLSNSLNKISNTVRELSLKIKKGELTPEEQKSWASTIEYKINIPFNTIKGDQETKARDIMEAMTELTEEMKIVDKNFQHYSGIAIADKSNKRKVPNVTNTEKQYKYVEVQTVISYYARQMKDLEFEYAVLHGALISKLSIVDYIGQNKLNAAPDGFSGIEGPKDYLRKIGVSISRLDKAITEVRTSDIREDEGGVIISEILKTDPKFYEDPIWANRKIGKKYITEVQERGIKQTDVENVTIEQFKDSPSYKRALVPMKKEAVKEAKRRVPQIDANRARENKPPMNERDINTLTDEIYGKKVSNYENEMTTKLYHLNEIAPNTWINGQAKMKLLDPVGFKGYNLIKMIRNTLQPPNPFDVVGKGQVNDDPEQYKHTISKTQLSEMTPENIRDRKFKDKVLNTYTKSYGTDSRVKSEIMNPEAHWLTLFEASRIQDLQKTGGKTKGEIFLEDIPERLKSEPDVLEVAAEIDMADFERRYEYAVAATMNENIPDWILMKVASGAVRLTQRQLTKGGFSRKILSLQRLAAQKLDERGWVLDTIERPSGKVEHIRDAKSIWNKALKDKGMHRFYKAYQTGSWTWKKKDEGVTDEVSIDAGDKKASILRQIKLAADSQTSGLVSQIKSENDQITQLQRQIEQHRQTISGLEKNKAVLDEEQGRVQEQSQDMMNNYNEGNPVQPAGDVSSMGPAMASSKTKYVVKYNKK